MKSSFVLTTTSSLLLVVWLLAVETCCCGGVTFSSLQTSLVVTCSAAATAQVLKAGEDKLTVTWSYNQTYPNGTDSTYKTVKVKLCYAPISQVDRSWRKTSDDLSKDKTCQFLIVGKPYAPSNSTFTWTIGENIPTATYFVRAYAFNSQGVQVAYGQTTNAHKTSDLFQVQGITGLTGSIDIASACFSAFSVFSLVGFFLLENRKALLSQQK